VWLSLRRLQLLLLLLCAQHTEQAPQALAVAVNHLAAPEQQETLTPTDAATCAQSPAPASPTHQPHTYLPLGLLLLLPAKHPHYAALLVL
jgi:hypothetical protein